MIYQFKSRGGQGEYSCVSGDDPFEKFTWLKRECAIESNLILRLYLDFSEYSILKNNIYGAFTLDQMIDSKTKTAFYVQDYKPGALITKGTPLNYTMQKILHADAKNLMAEAELEIGMRYDTKDPAAAFMILRLEEIAKANSRDVNSDVKLNKCSRTF